MMQSVATTMQVHATCSGHYKVSTGPYARRPLLATPHNTISHIAQALLSALWVEQQKHCIAAGQGILAPPLAPLPSSRWLCPQTLQHTNGCQAAPRAEGPAPEDFDCPDNMQWLGEMCNAPSTPTLYRAVAGWVPRSTFQEQ